VPAKGKLPVMQGEKGKNGGWAKVGPYQKKVCVDDGPRGEKLGEENLNKRDPKRSPARKKGLLGPNCQARKNNN